MLNCEFCAVSGGAFPTSSPLPLNATPLLQGLAMVGYLTTRRAAKMDAAAGGGAASTSGAVGFADVEADADKAAEVAALLRAEVEHRVRLAVAACREQMGAGLAAAAPGGFAESDATVLPPALMALPACQAMQLRLLPLQDLTSLRVR